MAVLDIAVHQDCTPITLAIIAERQGISLSYLEQIFSKLKKADLVESYRGPGGGYRLKRDQTELYLNEIIDAVDEDIDPRRCKGKQPCNGLSECASHVLWENLRKVIGDFLSSTSIEDVLKKNNHTLRK